MAAAISQLPGRPNMVRIQQPSKMKIRIRAKRTAIGRFLVACFTGIVADGCTCRRGAITCDQEAAHDFALRHGRLLRLGRGAGPAGTGRQAGHRGRLAGEAGRGVGGQLRRPQVRRPQRHARRHGPAALSARHLPAAQDRLLRRGLPADPRHLRAVHAAGRAAVAGRSLPGRDRQRKPVRPGGGDRPADQAGDPRRSCGWWPRWAWRPTSSWPRSPAT